MLVMIDNYDSFTHNLVRYFKELGQEVVVYRNDAINVQQLRDLAPQGLVISPGPGTPDDAGVSLPAIESFAGLVPLLGVCLGHQAIAQAYGAQVVRAQHVMHGKTSLVSHCQQGLFAKLPTPLRVTRYHSLVVAEDSIPQSLCVDARVATNQNACDNDDAVMAIRDPNQPVYGIQFHPESVLTEHGHALMSAFCQQAGLAVPANVSELGASLR